MKSLVLATIVLVWGCRLPSKESNPVDSASDRDSSCASGDVWTCPSRMALPCDGWWWEERAQWDSKEPGPWDVALSVYDMVEGLVPAECLASCDPVTKDWSCEAAKCTVADIAVDYRKEWIDLTYTGHKGMEKSRRDETVTADLRATNSAWSRIELVGARSGYESLDVDASWDGRMDSSLPDDGSFHFQVSYNGSDNSSSVRQTWTTPGCAVDVRQYTHGADEYNLTLTTPDSTLDIEVPDQHGCQPTHATLDGLSYEIEAEGWNIVGPDGDGDGYSVAGGDCDDTDARVSPCAGCDE